jgi:hypothetical protein
MMLLVWSLKAEKGAEMPLFCINKEDQTKKQYE